MRLCSSPGSFLGKRKPLAETLEAFTRTSDPRLRLLLKAQVKRREGMLAEAAERDSRIELLLEDQPTDEHLRHGRRLRRVPHAHALGGPGPAAL